MTGPMASRHHPQRVMLLGATGTIGRATAHALLEDGHEVVCLVRPGAADLPAGAVSRPAQVTDPASLRNDGFRGERFDALVSCLASRSGEPADAWAIDHAAHVAALAAAQEAGVGHMVLLSAICVQKPKLAFQHAKLAFEAKLAESGLAHSIVRPTAYFKSLSGQIGRVRKGRPFLLFGDGRLTATKPISDADLARYLSLCLRDPALRGILPIGGPGAAFTPRQQGEWLFEMLGRPPRFRQVPVAMFDAIIGSAVGAWRGVAEAPGQGRARPHRALLRHRVDAGVERGGGSLRRRRHAVIRQRDAARSLRRDHRGRAGAGPRRAPRVLIR